MKLQIPSARRLIVFTLLLAIVAAGRAGAQGAARQSTAGTSSGKAPSRVSSGGFERDRYRIGHRKFVLDNGLTLLVHEDHSAPVVSVHVWYHVGSRNERRGKTGFAHLFEHFFFNGSEHHPGGFREAMDDLGANNRNGTTSNDRTNFFEDVPVGALERTLYLEADRMGFLAPRISAEMLERERGVVQNEKRQGENEPYGRSFDRIFELLYPYSHPYSWPVIGSMEDLNAATLDDVKEWYRTYYGPNNAVISLAGDVTPERALELVRKYFGDIPPGPPLERVDEWVPRLERSIRSEMQDRVPQTRIFYAYHAPAWSDPELRYLDLLAEVLAGSKSARLSRRLVFEKELATDVSAFVMDNEISGMMVVDAMVKPGVDPATVERELDAAIAELIERGPTAAEVERARSRMLGDFVRDMERLGGSRGRAAILARSMTFGGDPTAYLDQLGTLAAATPADVKKAAATWIGANRLTLVVSPFPKLGAARSDVDRTVLPGLGAAPEVSFPQVQRATLKNGMSVLLLERHSVPLVTMTLAVDAGYASDPAGKAGTTSLAIDLLDEGTTTRDAYGIVDRIDELGGRLQARGSRDMSFVRLQVPSMNVARGLDVFADVALNPAFPQERFDVEKRRQLAAIEQEKVSPFDVASRVLSGILYGREHPLGQPGSGSGYTATVSSITRDDLVAWHRRWFRPNNTTLVVAGDVTMSALLPELERAFGAWRPAELPARPVATTTRTPGRKVYLIDRPGASQSLIVAAHLTEPSGQPEELAIEGVMRNFGGMSTSRLNRNLRLDKHWSYGTWGTIGTARGPRAFMVGAPVQTDKTKEAMVEVAREIRGVAGERPLVGEEYASLMRNLTMRLPGRFETLASLESAAIDIVNLGLPQDYWSSYARNVRGLTEAQLAEAARKFVRPDEVIWLVVGDLSKVESGIRELGYGEVIHLDADGNVVR